MTAAARLRALADQATAGPWRSSMAAVFAGEEFIAACQGDDYDRVDSDARLIALAPDTTRLLADCLDAMEWLRDYTKSRTRLDTPRVDALLADAERLTGDTTWISDRFKWPGPDQAACGAKASDRATGRTIYCCLDWNHKSDQHFWQEQRGDTLLSATWIATGPLTFVGTPPS